MGDQETMFATADWSEDSQMEECDPGAPLTVQTSSGRNPDYTHEDFVHKLKVQILPNDQGEPVGNSTLEWISALGIPMLTFEQPLQKVI